MRVTLFLIAAGASILFAAATPVSAQNPETPLAPAPNSIAPAERGDQLNCPPGVDERTAPSIGQDTTGSGENLSRQLSESKGIVCPPAGIDPGMVERPSTGGTLRVIPPPESSGSSPGVTPK